MSVAHFPSSQGPCIKPPETGMAVVSHAFRVDSAKAGGLVARGKSLVFSPLCFKSH